jgi:hypothetical protein
MDMTDSAMAIENLVQEWGASIGIPDRVALRAAAHLAATAYDTGGSVDDACRRARTYLGCYYRHPANHGRRLPTGVRLALVEPSRHAA